MPPRPSALKLKQNRPSSAIYLGNNPALSQSHSSSFSYGSNNSTPPNLPDLPEPPSPSASSSSHGSGLPSPPATNSTGSGSTGDPGSISIRQRPVSLNSSGSSDHSGTIQESMLNGASLDASIKKDEKPSSIYHQYSRAGSRHSLGPELIEGGEGEDEIDESGNDDGEDNTARLDRKISLQSSSENVLALQRLKRLTQRNQTTLDKLSSLSSSRLSTPSPSHAPRSVARSPIPPPSHSSSSSSSHASSSRLSQPRRPPPPPEQGLSGSETERESSFSHSNTHSSTSQHTHISSMPFSDRPRTPIHPSHNNPRFRLASAPTSPRHLSENTTTSSSSSSNNPHSPTRRRKRTSLATMSTPHLGMEHEDNETSTRKRDPRARGALPREFLRGDDGERSNLGGGRGTDRDGRSSAELITSHRSTHHQHHISTHQPPSVGQLRSPGRHQHNHSTSVRGYGTRFHQGRWASVDFSSGGVIDRTISSGSGTSSVSFDLDPERLSSSPISTGPKERRQSLRGGSVESVLGAGRTLVGQGLRAAGLGWRGDDTNGGGNTRVHLGPGEAKSEDVFKTPNRPRERRVEWSNRDIRGARDTDTDRRRAATSMADYRYADRDQDGDEPITAPPTALRSYRSAFPLRDSREGGTTITRETERERAGSALSRTESATSHHPERYSNPFDGRRRDRSSVPPPQAEHTKLMNDSLSMFESHLTRGGLAGGELSKNAQLIAHNAEKLNSILKRGVSRALEEEVEAEIDDEGAGTVELVEAWRSMGSDYRDGLKISDELVRGVTGFLLGIGKMLRDVGDIGHIRSVSGSAAVLTEQDARVRGSPDAAVSGRRSADSRRSWEPPQDREGGRDEALRKLTGRLDGSLDMPRPSSTLRNRDIRHETPPEVQGTPAAKATSKNPTGSMRRLFTPREQREQQMQLNDSGLMPSDSQDTVHGYEPSPSPAPRNQANQNVTLDRSRTLPPLKMPKPLPTLPSESTLRRNQTVSEKPSINTNRDRNKISVGSVTTVRGSIPPFPTISTPNATTALTTHTVSNSPAITASSLSRTDSDKSTRSMVIFSRPSTVSSVSALSGVQQQHLDYERSRTTSSTSSIVNADPSPAAKTKTSFQAPVTPMSGPETERDMRRKTVGARGMRMSLDNAPIESRTVNAADRSAASKVLPQLGSGNRRERRRTVTDIWPKD